jgi:hypothetical protein
VRQGAPSLIDRLDQVTNLLDMSKREFIEAAVSDALARAEEAIERSGALDQGACNAPLTGTIEQSPPWAVASTRRPARSFPLDLCSRSRASTAVVWFNSSPSQFRTPSPLKGVLVGWCPSRACLGSWRVREPSPMRGQGVRKDARNGQRPAALGDGQSPHPGTLAAA